MDEYSGKRVINRAMAAKKGFNTASKSLVRERDRSPQFCNRIGCSGRIKYSHSKRTQNLDISKRSNASVGNKVAVDSSVITTSRNTYVDGKRKLPSQTRCGSSESAPSSESEASELVPTPRSSSSSGNRSKLKKNSENITPSEASSSSGSSNFNNIRRGFGRKRTINHGNTSLPSSLSGKRTSLGPVKGSLMKGIAAPDSSSSDSNTSGKNIMRKRSQESQRNSSSPRVERKTSIASSSSSSVVNGHVLSFSSGIAIPGSGEDRNRAWTRRSASNINNPRTGFSRQNVRDHVPVGETLVNNSRGLSSSNGDNSATRTPFASSSETGSTHLMNRHDALRRYNMNDIAEQVLFALEMIEQDEELTHEQVRVLETSLLLGGLNLYDQHRDMRLDIDNMSYEELLALEERMGTVSTALSEEEISKCLEKGIFEQPPMYVSQLNGEDDAKCSICQEEYGVGDETGTLDGCRHGYHMSCVAQWLRLKNWCPVCKGSAVPSSS